MYCLSYAFNKQKNNGTIIPEFKCAYCLSYDLKWNKLSIKVWIAKTVDLIMKEICLLSSNYFSFKRCCQFHWLVPDFVIDHLEAVQN